MNKEILFIMLKMSVTFLWDIRHILYLIIHQNQPSLILKLNKTSDANDPMLSFKTETDENFS